ncbi:hypothetical protein [Flavobacterium johnsoniae]|uniref:Uncharacterized protein n=1 Tax=Flavobacterium johnsoniae TaxID=986 RepID=A0A1M5IWQ6_FLAJO|nr:hypothetical protein [Flavobacterium johnsoniae]SHG32400.1 hypothetical protein SAMN05444388_102273 [Flavobacterium johnsoniae]
MELKNLQLEKIDGIDFIKKIDSKIENLFIEEYKELQGNVSGLTETFVIDLGTFKNLLSDHSNKKFCKFYYTQESKVLNISISFSDNSECAIIKEDKIYSLDGKFIETDNFIKLKENYANDIGAKLKKQTEEEDTLVYYTLDEINSFIKKMKDSNPAVNKLKFNMWQYCPTEIDNDLSAHFIARNNRISFCVHALVINLQTNKILAESDGYDLGNLRP